MTLPGITDIPYLSLVVFLLADGEGWGMEPNKLTAKKASVFSNMFTLRDILYLPLLKKVINCTKLYLFALEMKQVDRPAL
jgi:hypothetical protein